jgi:hypothetical protein
VVSLAIFIEMADLVQRLKNMTQWTVDPQLSQPEIEDLISMFSLMDANGNPPTHNDWVQTVDILGAAAEGWRWKAGKAAAGVETELADGARNANQQKFEHCQEMIRQYSGKTNATLNITNLDLDIDAVRNSYTHSQPTPSDIWTINHNLGFNPSVTIFDSNSEEMDGDVTFPTLNQVIIYFISPVSGSARLV